MAAKRRKKRKKEEKERKMKGEADVFALCDRVRETSFALHCYLKHGHLEKVNENGLAHRLRKLGLTVEQPYPLAVLDEDGTALGDCFADLFIAGQLIAEVKACDTLHSADVAQLLGYLRACRIEHGLLINFGAPRLEIKKYVLSGR
jgi:GxxExxY protein